MRGAVPRCAAGRVACCARVAIANGTGLALAVLSRYRLRARRGFVLVTNYTPYYIMYKSLNLSLHIHLGTDCYCIARHHIMCIRGPAPALLDRKRATRTDLSRSSGNARTTTPRPCMGTVARVLDPMKGAGHRMQANRCSRSTPNLVLSIAHPYERRALPRFYKRIRFPHYHTFKVI